MMCFFLTNTRKQGLEWRLFCKASLASCRQAGVTFLANPLTTIGAISYPDKLRPTLACLISRMARFQLRNSRRVSRTQLLASRTQKCRPASSTLLRPSSDLLMSMVISSPMGWDESTPHHHLDIPFSWFLSFFSFLLVHLHVGICCAI